MQSFTLLGFEKQHKSYRLIYVNNSVIFHLKYILNVDKIISLLYTWVKLNEYNH